MGPSGIYRSPLKTRAGSAVVNGEAEECMRVAKSAQAAFEVLDDLPAADNEPGAVARMLQANGLLRNLPWPAPFDRTTHRLHLGDARDLAWLGDESVHLVVTSPGGRG